MEVPIGARASLTPMPAAAARSLAASVMPPLAGVYADAATASAFAAQWATAHRVVARPLDVQLLYELSQLRPARRATSGVLRRAAESERSLLLDWTRAFFGNGMRNPEVMVERDLAGGHLWVWETSHAVAMARVAPAVGGVARIYGVYAPQENRGQGYGTALVESLSRLLLEAGLRCSLTVRLNNPIANGIYARIGYQPVRELLTFAFGEARHAPSGPSTQPPVQL
jgi:predicted GNAT family acetyltransferase